MKAILFAFIALAIACPAKAAFWESICDAKDEKGVLACYDKERERIAAESEKSDRGLLAYCVKNSSDGCKKLEAAIAGRKKSEKAAKAYRDSLDGVKRGLETIGDSLENVFGQASESVKDFFGKDK